MHLNHLNLPVADVLKTTQFLKNYLGMTSMGFKETHVMTLLTDGHGMVLNIENFERHTHVSYPSTFHIGFMRESREAVDELYSRLVEAGYEIDPPRVFHGAWTFYVQAPGDFTVEVQYRLPT